MFIYEIWQVCHKWFAINWHLWRLNLFINVWSAKKRLCVGENAHFLSFSISLVTGFTLIWLDIGCQSLIIDSFYSRQTWLVARDFTRVNLSLTHLSWVAASAPLGSYFTNQAYLQNYKVSQLKIHTIWK